MCEREPHNVEDRYAIAIKKDETVIGQLVKSVFAFYMMRRNDRVYCNWSEIFVVENISCVLFS